MDLTSMDGPSGYLETISSRHQSRRRPPRCQGGSANPTALTWIPPFVVRPVTPTRRETSPLASTHHKIARARWTPALMQGARLYRASWTPALISGARSRSRTIVRATRRTGTRRRARLHCTLGAPWADNPAPRQPPLTLGLPRTPRPLLELRASA